MSRTEVFIVLLVVVLIGVLVMLFSSLHDLFAAVDQHGGWKSVFERIWEGEK